MVIDDADEKKSHICIDCGTTSPSTDTNYTLISARHGWRLTVVASRFVEAGWGWVAPVGQRAQPITCRPAARMLENIDSHLSAILAGAAAPG